MRLVKKPPEYPPSEPATRENAITYEYFCLLGGLENPRCSRVKHENGSYVYSTYHYARY